MKTLIKAMQQLEALGPGYHSWSSFAMAGKNNRSNTIRSLKRRRWVEEAPPNEGHPVGGCRMTDRGRAFLRDVSEAMTQAEITAAAAALAQPVAGADAAAPSPQEKP